jgi:hypothetical protein
MADQNSIDQNHFFPEPSTQKQGDYVPRVISTPEAEVVQTQTPPPQYSQQTQSNSNVYQQPDLNQNGFYQNVQQSVEQNAYFQVGNEPEVQPTQSKKPLMDTTGFTKKFSAFVSAKKWFIIGIVGVLIVAGVGVGAFLMLNQVPTSQYLGVTARIEAPQTAPSGTPNRWRVTIQNTEKVSIQNIEVKLEFDRAFRYTKPINPDPADPKGNLYKLASLQAVGQGTSDAILSFEGVLTGVIDEETTMKGEVSYTPTPLAGKQNSRRTVSIQASKTRITAPEIKVEMIPTQQEVQNGTEAEITVFFENLSERELKDVRLRMIYPGKGDFSYSTSELTLTTTGDTKTKPDDGNDIWFISSLPRLKKQQLKVRGVLNGANGVKQNFGVEIGIKSNDGYQTLQTTSRDVTIASQPLILTTKLQGRDINQTFAPGETLNFEVAYQNQSTTTLRNVEVLASIEDPAEVLDYATLQFAGGTGGNINNRVIQWRGSGVPQLENLAPQVRGVLQYSIKVKNNEEFIRSGLSQTAYTVRPFSEAKGQNLPQVKSSGENYKGRGDISIEQSFKEDPNGSSAQNRKVYDVTLSIKSRQTKINDVVYETNTLLPPNSWNQSTISPASFADKISYNQQNGKIVWNVGSVGAYSGLSNPVISVTFKLTVELTPGKSFGGVEITGDGTLRGVDDFTAEKYEKKLTRQVLTR